MRATVILAVMAVLLAILPTAVPVIKTSAAFSVFNTKWDGCSKFASLLRREGNLIPILYPFNDVKLADLKGTLVIIGPDIPYSRQEADQVKAFLENGGTLFIADDFGSANTLLKYLGIDARFSGKRLEDLFYSKNSNFPVEVHITDKRLAAGVREVVMDIPSFIVGRGKVLMYSSSASYSSGKMGRRILMLELRYGRGRVILLSDPSVLINDLYNKNKVFIENLVNYIKSKNFYVDEAHHSDLNPYSMTVVYVHKDLTRSECLKLFIAVLAISLVAESGFPLKILERISRIFEKEEDVLENLPEWVDRDVVRRMLEEMEKGSRLLRP